MSAGAAERGVSGAIAAGCGEARRLGGLLEEEFKALSAQDLPRFESLQAQKEQILVALAQLVQELTAAGETGAAAANGAGATAAGTAPDAAQWEQFQQLMSDCREAHRRNDILIRTKLESIRAALRILQNSESSSSVEVYDRMGRMYGYRRGRGYEDA